MNSTQKINRARKARGLAPWGNAEFEAHFRARSGAATMRPLFFDPQWKFEQRRAIRDVFRIEQVLP